MPAGTAARAWVLVLALWGETLPAPTLPLSSPAPTPPPVPPCPLEIPLNLGTTFQRPSPTLSYTRTPQPHLSPSTLPQ
jgi:hypothetical protein|uniref:Isoform 11 of Advanced glycosylation end product-specific receptor n=1 Tax=Mus musculus TaxID=10090 RepID=Q62151-11|nr:advanced glycosylation end products receptor splice variant 2 [Mus musculus]ACE63496.1 advanced glycosylation end products receptor splice variant 5 [Mus musculus]ACE63497.1 advanced glycosylation end products receptor splice variant 6 [Mus musculus]ACE63499.1 advanced glycosylation end products receptor splice variant 8 [Mus musculus]ACK28150.1 receptor for advanced glycation end-products splice variant 16 [Mus musculus]